jgi:hypothetical protein
MPQIRAGRILHEVKRLELLIAGYLGWGRTKPSLVTFLFAPGLDPA